MKYSLVTQILSKAMLISHISNRRCASLLDSCPW